EAVEIIKQRLIAEKGISADVDIVTKVDPSLIGGMVLEFGGQLYNASVSRKLKAFKKNFQGNLYISQIERK
ncbi:MAG: F0F1 ATP synthase subunit delta, partial [Bacteroidota bacterium]